MFIEYINIVSFGPAGATETTVSKQQNNKKGKKIWKQTIINHILQVEEGTMQCLKN